MIRDSSRSPRQNPSRRDALGSAGTAVAAITGAAVLGLPSRAGAAIAGGPAASGELGRFFAGFFAAKSAHSPGRTMAYFDPATTIYTDATLGWQFPTWAALKALFEQYMPGWPPQARSYPTAIEGDASGAIIRFTNTPQEFGAEIRGIAAVDIRDWQIVRWVDYWDGRHFGVARTAQLRTPTAQFPSQFGEQITGEHASPQLTAAVRALASALGGSDAAALASLLSADVIAEDLTLHTEVIGAQSVSSYLARAAATLPYGADASIRHIVGGHAGGGYEWVTSRGPVPRGITALTLAPDGLISRMTSIWDGSLVSADWLQQAAAQTIES